MRRLLEFFIKNRSSLAVLTIIIICFLIVYSLALIFNTQYYLINSQINDSFFRLRYQLSGKRPISPYLIHVVLSDSSRQKLNSSVWDRTIYARAFNILSQCQAAAIASDIVFQDRNVNESDQMLIMSVKQSKNIFLPTVALLDKFMTMLPDENIHDYNGESIQQQIWYPSIIKQGDPLRSSFTLGCFSELTQNAKGIGHITCEPDADGIYRRFPLVIKYKQGYLPCLVLSMLCEYFQVTPDNVEVDFGKHILLKDARLQSGIIKNIRIPIDNSGQLIINWAGPWDDSFLQFPIHKILDTENNPALKNQLFDLIQGSLILISDISSRNKDYGPAVLDSVYPLSGIHLNIANMILMENFMHQPGWIETLLLSFLIMCALFIISLLKRGRFFMLGSLAIFIIFFCLETVLFLLTARLTDLILPSAIFIFASVSLSFYRLLREEKSKSLLKAKIEVNEKLDRFKRHFMQNITHELRNPLMLILEPTQALLTQKRKNLNETVKTNLSSVHENADKLLKLTTQFLDLEKADKGRLKFIAQSLNLSQLIKSIIKLYDGLSKKKRIHIILKNESQKDIIVYGDPVKLEQIFNNLLSNSIKFSKPDTTITVCISAQIPFTQSKYKADWPYQSPDALVTISIKDEGQGITKKDIPFIFNRFWQTDDTSHTEHGMGIGLALVKEYTQLHYGKVYVNSILGKGSEFTVVLPLGKKHLKKDEIAIILHNHSITTTAEAEIAQPANQAGKKIDYLKGNHPSKPILLIDDDAAVLKSYYDHLLKNGYNNVILCSDAREVLPLLRKQTVSLVILDLSLPYIDGERLLKEIKEELPELPVIIATGNERVESAVNCLKTGAFDYMVKPFDRTRLLSNIKHCLELYELEKEVNLLSNKLKAPKLKSPQIFEQIITQNQKMFSIFMLIEAIAQNEKPILITGESGVGKELIAYAIHKASERSGEFVSINIAGLDDTIFSDTLFGHTKGAFTGAMSDRKGLIEQAQGGTLFLDEIGDLENGSQVKLLRLLQEGEYYPLGSDKPKHSNSRILLATNVNLRDKINEGLFRKDLYHRLTLSIHIPPLRERFDDLPLLVDYFMKEASRSFHKKEPTVPKELLTLLRTFSFPGNIRELKHMIENAVSRHKTKVLSLSYFKEYIQQNSKLNESSDLIFQEPERIITFEGAFPTLKQVEESLISKAMEKAQGNQRIAAQLLGIDPSTLSRKLKKQE
ncbi:MAG: sigma 54-interacting transcriptional regulator [Spirochaetales bacterium]|nr:sigma 54-interacting transcriptional regulator [Spirochaetales bacterium]